ncbi:MAG: cell division protein FtsA [Bacteroidota bacterium]|nr:cell division protein FtsA [Bacteroidota bacterium]
MDNSDIIVGLDIGTSKIAAIVGRWNQYNKLEILGYGKTESSGVKRGVVINIDNTVNSIQEAIKEASTKSNVNIRSVNVGIAGQHIKSMQHRGYMIRSNSETEIVQEELDQLTANMYKLAMNPGDEIISVTPQEYTIDGEPGVTQPKGMMGSKIEANFHIITAQTTAAKNIYKCVTKAGLNVSELILEPHASSRAVLSEEEKEAGVALVDIGGGTSDIAIFYNGIIRHTAVVPFGGEVITEDVKEGCNILKKHAEDLKIRFGSALAKENRDDELVSIPGLRGRPAKEISLRNLASIIQARMEEILEQVYFEIKNSGYERKLGAGIVLTGGGSQLRHLAQLTEFLTGLDTRIGLPSEHLAQETQPELLGPTFATGIGLVLMGLESTKEQYTQNTGSEKLPQEEKPKKPNGLIRMLTNLIAADEEVK